MNLIKKMKEKDNDEDLDKETAMAKAIEGLTTYDPIKAIVLTEFTQKEINGFTSLLAWEKFLKARRVETNLITTISQEYLLRKISKSRKGKKELVEVLKNEQAKEEKGSLTDRLKSTLKGGAFD